MKKEIRESRLRATFSQTGTMASSFRFSPFCARSLVIGVLLISLSLDAAWMPTRLMTSAEASADREGAGYCMHDVLMERASQNLAIVSAHTAGLHRTAAVYEQTMPGTPVLTIAPSHVTNEKSPFGHSSSLIPPFIEDASTTVSAPTLESSQYPSEEARDATWQPLRFRTFTADLFKSGKFCENEGDTVPDFMGNNRTCTKDEILTAEKRDVLLEYLLPEALALHSNRLSVRPLASLSLGHSMDDNNGTNPFCSNFTSEGVVPPEAMTGVDFILFVAAGTMDPQYQAWAYICGYLANGHPTVGVINVSPRLIEHTTQAVRIVAHEVLHALGFNTNTFRQRGVTSIARHVREKPAVTAVTSRNVLRRAGNHFHCDYMVGMELDDSAGVGSSSSHWNARNAREDLMSPVVGPAMKYSAITMAAMEDLGYYKPNYDYAEYMDWGFRRGCGLLDHKCLLSGRSIDASVFCDSEGNSQCTSDRTAVGTCVIAHVGQTLPPYFQYFRDPTLGGARAADYCPVITAYSNGGCRDGDAKSLPGSVVGPSARCLDRAGYSTLRMPICAEVACDAANMTYSVKFLEAEGWVPCPVGTVVDASLSSPRAFLWSSTVICPPYPSVCPSVFNDVSLEVELSPGGKLSGANENDGAATIPLLARTSLTTVASLGAIFTSLFLVC